MNSSGIIWEYGYLQTLNKKGINTFFNNQFYRGLKADQTQPLFLEPTPKHIKFFLTQINILTQPCRS